MNKYALQTSKHLNTVDKPYNPTINMSNTPIELNFVAPPLRVIPIHELIYTYMDCRAVNFTPPAYKTMKACAGIFRLVSVSYTHLDAADE